MDAPGAWARGRLPDGDGRVVSLDINGFTLDCTVPADGGEPEGATSFGLLAAALSACTAMSVRTFLQRFDLARATVEVDVSLESGPPPVLHRRVGLAADLDRDSREQLAAVVDSTPVTVLLRDALVIVTRLDVGAPA
ncbi:OsmC family protein [Actinomycetospora cinnamomea]|uniref:Putative OsmC-like protein n=1 Tax=Actinomycetospora cinnamomea TaxID=663609 RepID=A0A2U1FII5_9PSEU|nr:OsmC family protein [Actinomycetospora cinnamomea]PVZ11979.1 putative OsmC-like protein [Actinomycetospora cinnamomea]